MLKIKLDKSKFTEFMESLVMRRFESKEALENEIYNKTNINLSLDFDGSQNDIEKSEGYDYCLKSNLTINNEDLCYVDIYFLKDHSKQLYITEVGLDFNT